MAPRRGCCEGCARIGVIPKARTGVRVSGVRLDDIGDSSYAA
jgi:hypothetical protein